jgi:hypothetical protein
MFYDALQHITLRTVRHQITQAGSKTHLVNLKLSVLRAVTYFTIFFPTAHNKKTLVSNIYTPRFGLNWPSLRRWLTKTRLVPNYVTDILFDVTEQQTPNLISWRKCWSDSCRLGSFHSLLLCKPIYPFKFCQTSSLRNNTSDFIIFHALILPLNCRN